jgi:hypothetical protein
VDVVKRIYWVCIFSCLAGGVFAQDLDTVTITDQMNSGERGNNIGSLTDGGALIDGSEYADYNGPDLTASITTSVRYINSWGTDGSIESPVVTVTSAMDNPDRFLVGAIPAIPANNRPGATGGSTALQVGDNGGFNAIFFGESNDRDYYIEADLFCWNHPGADAADFEVAGIAARAARDNDTSMTERTYNVDRAGSYCIFYDYQLREVKAVRWTIGNSFTTVQTRNPASYTQFGSTISNVTEGWHTMKIECKDSTIEFRFDGAVIATVVDSTLFNGRPGLYYREFDVVSADERQGLFDNLRAGPATLVSTVSDWSVY